MGYNIINRDGRIIGHVESEEEASSLMENVPENIHTFFVGGSQTSIDKFFLDANGALGASPTFFEMLSAKYGKVPNSIVPFEEIKEAFFSNNSAFIKMRVDVLDSRLVSQLLKVLKRTIPAGSTFFVIVERRELEEGFSLSNAEEGITIFYSPELTDELHNTFGETILTSLVL